MAPSLARNGRIQRLTTAAIIWILAAVSSMIGLGLYRAAVATTFTVLAIVNAVDHLEARGILPKIR